jgi:hypothetical protein
VIIGLKVNSLWSSILRRGIVQVNSILPMLLYIVCIIVGLLRACATWEASDLQEAL